MLTYELVLDETGNVASAQATFSDGEIAESWKPCSYRTVPQWVSSALQNGFDITRISVRAPSARKFRDYLGRPIPESTSADILGLSNNHGVYGIGPGGWDSGALARAQERKGFYRRLQTLTEREQTRRYGQ